ncbi:Pumilio domain-containing protein [Elsinoe australis]|uniref:Pumilio domain-containing protein n=1 Tax=Elsinoe australis TaxID=40998 RepID=A0A2P7ZYW2_9PEZI|nr:Pumilio domain-containing protein [Elsinoe australis]
MPLDPYAHSTLICMPMSRYGDYMQFPASGEDVAALGQKLDNILAALQKLSTKDDHEETEERDTPPICEPNPSKASSTATSIIYTPESSDIEIDGSSSPTQAVMHADSTIPNLDIETLAKILIGYHDLSNNATARAKGGHHIEIHQLVKMIKNIVTKSSHTDIIARDSSDLPSDLGSQSHQHGDQQQLSNEDFDNLLKRRDEAEAKCDELQHAHQQSQYSIEAMRTFVAQQPEPSTNAEARAS